VRNCARRRFGPHLVRVQFVQFLRIPARVRLVQPVRHGVEVEQSRSPERSPQMEANVPSRLRTALDERGWSQTRLMSRTRASASHPLCGDGAGQPPYRGVPLGERSCQGRNGLTPLDQPATRKHDFLVLPRHPTAPKEYPNF